MKPIIKLATLLAIPIVLANCDLKKSKETTLSVGTKPIASFTNEVFSDFKSFWYAGKAEVSSYQLTQARYGELRKGEAELIFVTEDFSCSKQVKLDNPQSAQNDAVSVLKMNMVKKFNTGIYPYSMMLSVFSPVAGGHAIKTTSSVQEWCGQTFTQFNLKDSSYHVQLHSYFESEGEADTTLALNWQEDEIWTLLRINPSSVPTGDINMIPGAMSQRLRHSPILPVEAKATIRTADSAEAARFGNASLKVYTLNYLSEKRSLSIFFTDKFPYSIEGWEEVYPDGFGDNKKMLTTVAVKKKTIMVDYWKHNSESDSVMRDSLGLMRYH
jgi:hypothetical protein